jgi:Helix-turn-helix domain
MAFNKLQYFACTIGVEMTPTAARVLTMIFHYSDGNGRNAYPGIDRLAAECCAHRTSVIKALKELQKLGLIRVQAPGKGRTHATVYALSTPVNSSASATVSDHIKGSVRDTKGSVSAKNGSASALEKVAPVLPHQTNTKPIHQTINTKAADADDDERPPAWMGWDDDDEDREAMKRKAKADADREWGRDEG